MYNNMTYEQCIEKACEDTIGTCNMGNSDLTSALEFYLEREVTDEDYVAAEDYMDAVGIHYCSVCGWVCDDQDGPEGDMCSDCAKDTADEENENENENDESI